MSSKSGIYKIRNKVNFKIYVGSAVKFNIRWSQHQSALYANNHPNRYLQNAWNKHGPDNFEFMILEIVQDKTKLLEREQFWLDWLIPCDTTKGYNINPTAGSNLGRPVSQETRAKMAIAMKGKKASPAARAKMSAWQQGRKMSDEAKVNMSKARRDASTWPHEKGALCKCKECKDRRNVEMRIWQFEYKTSAFIYGQMGMM